MSLLDKAKSIPHKRMKRDDEITNDHIKLAIAFLKEEVTMTQVTHALGLRLSANSGYFLLRCLRKGFRKGIIHE